MNEKIPETTVLIRAFNEERWLPEVFAALARQRYRDFVVVLVDSGSVDRTREIAAANGARIVRMRTEDFTFGHSLNVGIRQSQSPYIAILSAHAIPSDEGWLERLVAPLRESDVAMVYGGQRGHDYSKFSEARDFERIFPSQARAVTDPDNPFANNANSIIKRELWAQCPYDEGLPGLEDIGWAKHWIERGYKVQYEPAACIVHVHTETWSQVRRRYHREGMGARWVGIKILRHIPGEILREILWLSHDLWLAAKAPRAASVVRDIFRFRYEKAVGTISGIVDSRGMSNPAARAEIFSQKEYPALVVRGPHRVRLEERTVPSLKPGEVLVRVSHVGVCATDQEIIEGSLGYYKTGMAQYPIVPGHESSGTVVALGPRVTSVNERDRVVVECIQGCGECRECARDEAIRCSDRREVGVIGQDGACAEYLITRARYLHRVPESVSLAEAALAEPLAVVIKGLRRLGSRPTGDKARRCAVFGAGTIGHFAARILSLRGHSVTVIDRQSERLSLLNGAVATSSEIADLSEFEWLVEATGSQAVLSKVLQQASTGATLLLLGLPYSDQPFNFESIVAFDRTVIGSVGSSASDFDEALATLPQIDTAPFRKAWYPLEQYEKAFSAARSKDESEGHAPGRFNFRQVAPSGLTSSRVAVGTPAVAADKKLNLLILVAGLGIGGAEVAIKHLVHGIDRHKFNVTVCCIKYPGMIGEELAREGIDLVVLSEPGTQHTDYLTFIKLWRLLRAKRTEIVHTHTTDALADAAMCRLMMPRLKLVHTFHFGNYPNAEKRNMRIERACWRMASRLVAVGEVQCQQIRSTFRIRESSIQTIWNGVPCDSVAPDGSFRRRVGGTSRVLIGTIATFIPQKGLSDLLEVAYRLRKMDRRVLFVIVGDGELRPELEAMRDRLGLADAVLLPGLIKDASKVALPEFDVFFQPSLWEAMSIAVLEAMAAGRAIVATRVGENPRVIEHECDGLLVEPGDLDGMTEAIARLVDDDCLRQRLGSAAARKASEQYTVDRMARSYEKIYQG